MMGGADVTLALDVDDTDPPAGLFEITDEGNAWGVRLIGKGETPSDALRDAAQRIEDGDEDLVGL